MNFRKPALVTLGLAMLSLSACSSAISGDTSPPKDTTVVVPPGGSATTTTTTTPPKD